MTIDVETLREALREVFDPEAGVNIVDLGLVCRLEAGDDFVELDLTMTSPACPLGETIAADATAAIESRVPAFTWVDVRLVADPPWTPERMTDDARRHFGWDP